MSVIADSRSAQVRLGSLSLRRLSNWSRSSTSSFISCAIRKSNSGDRSKRGNTKVDKKRLREYEEALKKKIKLRQHENKKRRDKIAKKAKFSPSRPSNLHSSPLNVYARDTLQSCVQVVDDISIRLRYWGLFRPEVLMAISAVIIAYVGHVGTAKGWFKNYKVREMRFNLMLCALVLCRLLCCLNYSFFQEAKLFNFFCNVTINVCDRLKWTYAILFANIQIYFVFLSTFVF